MEQSLITMNSYVIFICDFDPFNQRKYCYTFKSICKETDETDLEDGRVTIFLSTEGENEDEVPIEMVKFLKFVKADLATCMDDFEDESPQKHLSFPNPYTYNILESNDKNSYLTQYPAAAVPEHTKRHTNH